MQMTAETFSSQRAADEEEKTNLLARIIAMIDP
jgi:hypothetical protein